MALAPTPQELLARARSDLRAGVAIVLSKDGQSVLAAAAEISTDTQLGDFRALGRPVVAITRRRAETLKAMCYDGDIARVSVPGDATQSWITALADPADDLRTPMKGPIQAERGGDAALHRGAISLLKVARLLPAALIVSVADGQELAKSHGLTHITLDTETTGFSEMNPLDLIVSARVPLEVSKAGRVYVFRPTDGGEEHYAIEIGQPDRGKPVLCRLHSACFTGDLLGSLKCDCGAQLRAALQQMGEQGSGVLLYLNQEGRGIGLANKMRAYSLQDQGFDTVEANHRLGFEDDERDFKIGANILKKLGLSAVNLLTNNPTKVEMMQDSGIKVARRVPLIAGHTEHNRNYLATKATKSGHLF